MSRTSLAYPIRLLCRVMLPRKYQACLPMSTRVADRRAHGGHETPDRRPVAVPLMASLSSGISRLEISRERRCGWVLPTLISVRASLVRSERGRNPQKNMGQLWSVFALPTMADRWPRYVAPSLVTSPTNVPRPSAIWLTQFSGSNTRSPTSRGGCPRHR